MSNILLSLLLAAILGLPWLVAFFYGSLSGPVAAGLYGGTTPILASST